MFLIIGLRKKFKNVMLVLFLELFDQEYKFEHNLGIFLRIFFQGNLEIILFSIFY